MIELDGVEYMTVDEVCHLLNVKPATIYAYVSRGILTSYRQRVGRARLYRRDEVETLRQVQASERRNSPQEERPQATEGLLPNAEEWIGEP